MDMMLCNLVEGYQYFRQTPCHLKMVAAEFLEMLVQYLPTNYRGADKSLARPERKQATVTEDFEFYISYL
jgi:hypothetical protein